MEERLRRKALIFSWTGAAVLLAALAAANVVSTLLFARADFSAGRAYSLRRLRTPRTRMPPAKRYSEQGSISA